MKKFIPFLITAAFSIILSLYFYQALFRSPEPTKIYVVSSKIEESRKEIASLRLQLENSKNFQSSILDTVYWSLSTVLGMLTLLVGFNWFSNYKQQEDEKKSYQKQVDEKIQSLATSCNAAISQNSTQVYEKIEVKLQELKAELIGIITKFTQDNQNEINQLRDVIKSKTEETAALTELIHENKRLFNIAMSELRDAEENIWELKGVPQNIVITQCQKLAAYKAAEWTELIPATLKEIKTTIETKIIAENVTFRESAKIVMLDTLNDFKSDDPILVSEIIQMIEDNTITTNEQE